MARTVDSDADVLLPHLESAMATELSPTARALRALEIIQTQPGIGADRLAARLGVSDRAARRYVAILREAGIPVVSVPGPAGGYRLGRGLRLPPLVFTQTEALSLVMAVLDGHHAAADPDDPVGRALAILLQSLPEAVSAQAGVVRSAAAAAPDRSAARPDPVTTVTLVQACADHRRVVVGYRTGAGTEIEAEVDPWSVLVRHGRWYLLCRLSRTDAVRTYRVDRVTSVRLLDEAADPPPDDDPVILLEENLAAGWEFSTEVLVEAPRAALAPCVPRILGRLEPTGDATTRLVGTTSNPRWYAEQLATLPAEFRVLGGPELVAATREVARRLLAAVDAR
jgi:predicted DNA-binding transcriptional regulator YafY